MNTFIRAARLLAPVKALQLTALLLLFSFVTYGQQRTVTGIVRSQSNRGAISSATVTVKGSSRSVKTNEDGRFSIVASNGDVLQISSVGYSSKEINIAASANNLNVLLNESAKDMEAVVVTALGIKREERALGYSATTVKGDALTSAVSSNWTDALSGKVAGLNLVRSNSGPTGSNKIILRGENNLTGDNEALIVVDGVVINQGSGRRTGVAGEAVYGTGSDNMPADYGGSLNDINPEDIESVTVLKGPGAAALYGE
jgi:outer membrane receptor protein involved in Fe transport